MSFGLGKLYKCGNFLKAGISLVGIMKLRTATFIAVNVTIGCKSKHKSSNYGFSKINLRHSGNVVVEKYSTRAKYRQSNHKG